MIDRLKENWDDIKDTLKENYDISKVSYDTWIVPMEIHNVDNDQVYILADTKGIPNILDYIKKKYKQILEIVIEEKIGLHCNVIFVTSEDLEKRPNLTAEASNIVTPELNSYYAAVMNANLNPRYTFDTFVVGSNNRFAHAASLAVAESPGTLYNPLFIYGGAGLGKTHLMQSIAHYILRNDPSVRVLYVTSETFTNDLIDSLKGKKNAEFKEKYRSIDVLMIDDIQFLIGKESTQEEFFHTFNTLHNDGRQIVIASDRPAKEIKSLEERLRTRFEWGLTADIQPPDFETRVAIVKRKAELLNLDLPNDVAEYIANHLKQNIRQLEGAVKKLNAYYLLEGIEPCIGVTTTAIKDTLNDSQPIPVTIEKILNEVARTYNVMPSDIRGKKRNANVSAARQMTMYIIREVTGMSMEAIGQEFQRDHSTVVYSIKTMEENIKRDQHLKEMCSDIMKNVRT